MPDSTEPTPCARRSFEQQVSSVASLGEPLRRALYQFVTSQNAPVSRDQAAAALGMARHVVKFHLDRLEDEGLLEVEYSRPPDRRGPGAGRPAKLYRRAHQQFTVSLPERRYELAGQIMAQAITIAERDGVPISQAVGHCARHAGRDLGVASVAQAESRPDLAARRRLLSEILTDVGYEPRGADSDITLANCPFYDLAADHTALVCGMNLEFLQALLAELSPTGMHAVLDPGEGRCCVRVRES